DHHVAAAERVSDRFSLMCVELRNAPRGERVPQTIVERAGKRRPRGWRRRQTANGGDVAVRCVGPFGGREIAREAFERGIERAIAARGARDCSAWLRVLVHGGT